MIADKLTNEILSAFEGICYVTDRSGMIVSVGVTAWEDFADKNNAPSLSATSLIGKSCFDYIQGDDVKSH